MVLASGLIFYKSDIDVQDEEGNTALFYAAKYGNDKFIKFLIDHGADPNTRCKGNNTPMHAVFQSNDELVIINNFL